MTPTSPIKTLIVEDHDLMARGIREFLETVPMVQMVATAGNGEEARCLVQSQEIDLVIMDIRLGPGLNGISLTAEFKKEYPELAVLIYSGDENVELVRQAIAAGARGYVPKGAGIEKIRTAIEIVMAGGSYFPKLPRDIEPLTPREEEVLKLIAEGKNNEQISQKLEITLAGVKAHRANIMSKLGINNAVDLYIYARRRFPNLDGQDPYG